MTIYVLKINIWILYGLAHILPSPYLKNEIITNHLIINN